MLECPYCGRDLLEGGWDEKPNWSDNTISFKITCKCGHEFEEVYKSVGIYDRESGDYIYFY